MMKYCLEKWDKNRSALEENIRQDGDWNDCDYAFIVRKVIDIILNDNRTMRKWSSIDIIETGAGDYQGTLVYLIPSDYPEDESDYLMTFVGYGSCSVCDTLEGILCENDFDRKVKDFMQLCKDIVCNMIKPYNHGWRSSDAFEHVEVPQA